MMFHSECYVTLSEVTFSFCESNYNYDFLFYSQINVYKPITGLLGQCVARGGGGHHHKGSLIECLDCWHVHD